MVADRVRVAATFFSRFRGLMLCARLEDGEGLLLRDCPSIHMLFMRFPIDAVFLKRDGTVVKVAENLPPWTGMAWAAADDVLEVPAGTIRKTGLKAGERLEIIY